MTDRIVLYTKSLNEKSLLLLLLAITFGLRLYAVLTALGIANDSAGYGFMARDFLRGDYFEALSPALHPLYPYLISLVSPNAASVEITGRLISLLFGTFTLIPVYYLVKEAFGQKEALFSGLFYCFHPYLVAYSGMLLSEATYWGLLALSVYFFWFGLKRGKSYQIIMAGVLLSLAYLARPEGMGYLAIFVLWLVIYGGIKKNGLWKLVLIPSLIFTFLIPAAPYLIHIRKETGQWFISKKAFDTQIEFIAPVKMKEEKQETRPAKVPKTGKKRIKIPGIVINISRFLPFTFYHYLRAYHFTLWIFLFLGLIRMRTGGTKAELFLASLVLFHLVSLSTFIPSTIRFSVPVVAISLFWAGTGTMELFRILAKLKVSNPGKWLSLLISLILVAQLVQIMRPERRHRLEQKTVGIWIRENTPASAVIMSNSPQEAFYAIRRFVHLPTGRKSYDEVVHFAKEKGVQYVLINKNTKETSPDFVNSIPSPDLKEVYRYQNKKGDITVVYEIRD